MGKSRILNKFSLFLIYVLFMSLFFSSVYLMVLATAINLYPSELYVNNFPDNQVLDKFVHGDEIVLYPGSNISIIYQLSSGTYELAYRYPLIHLTAINGSTNIWINTTVGGGISSSYLSVGNYSEEYGVGEIDYSAGRVPKDKVTITIFNVGKYPLKIKAENAYITIYHPIVYVIVNIGRHLLTIVGLTGSYTVDYLIIIGISTISAPVSIILTLITVILLRRKH